MGKFKASLRLPGDSKALAATIQLGEGRFQVASGEHVIGDWDIASVDISRIPEGIRVAVEGEVMLLDIADRAAFEEAASSLGGKSKGSSRARKSSRKPRERHARSKTVTPTPSRTATTVDTATGGGESRLDRFLEWAKDRFGSTLPDWVFTKGGLLAIVALIAFCVVFAELVSTLLLIAGVIALLTGGVTMLDSVIARRILRHKVTPIQVVIGGGSIFVAGLLVGVVA
ncbi:MAG TPA: hypothetical protein VIH55_07400 [Acidimicrobiia bacterium]